MRSVLLIAATALIAGLASAQTTSGKDAIYYPFLTGKGTTVNNLWANGGLAPKTGTITSTNKASWVTGRSGSALSGRENSTSHNYVKTGWKAASGQTTLFSSKTFSFGFFIKRRHSPNTLANYFFSGVGSFRLFTGGTANNGLYLRVWGGTPADLILPRSTAANGYDVAGEAAKRWLHIAMVVDTGAGTATWYIDGAQHLVIKNVAGTAAPAGTTEMLINRHTGDGSASDYDMDDFRFTTRAVGPCEVARWALAKARCDNDSISLGSGGKQNVSLDFGSSNASNIYWLFGSFTGTTPGIKLGATTIPLNYDAYTGITISNANGTIWQKTRGNLDASGSATATLNVPKVNLPILIGLTLQHAAVVWDKTGINILDASNPIPLTLAK